ncbi:ataxia telangiectasia mutated family protein [Tanacetum coccineum]
MPGLHLIRSLMEKYRERQRDLHLDFLDLEKEYDSVPRELIWKTLVDKGTSRRYIKVIKDMYDGAKTRVRTSIGNMEFFPVEVGIHQGSTISPYLFALILDELSRWIQEDIPWCLIFADDIALVSESAKVEIVHNEEVDIHIGDKILQPKESFRYLGSMIHKSRRIDEDVSHRIKTAWLKWRAATEVLCDRNIPLKLKGKFYRVEIRPFMLYGSECWPITKALANRMEVAELRMLRWTCGKTMLDMIPNGVYRAELEVETIINKMREGRLRWFGHVRRRPQSAPVRRVEALVVDCVRRRGRPKLRWEDRVKHDLKELILSEDMTSDRNEWRARISSVFILPALRAMHVLVFHQCFMWFAFYVPFALCLVLPSPVESGFMDVAFGCLGAFVLLLWPPRVTLGRLLPHERGLEFKPRREGFSLGAKKERSLPPKAKIVIAVSDIKGICVRLKLVEKAKDK